MTTGWLDKAFVDLAGRSSSEAQELLRQWVTSRMLSMSDYHVLADRLTAAYLDRDTRRAANAAHMQQRRPKTGRLIPPGDHGSPAISDRSPIKPPDPAAKPGATLQNLSRPAPPTIQSRYDSPHARRQPRHSRPR